LCPQFLKTAEAGHLEMYVNTLRQLAVEEQVTCLDLYLLWEQMEKSGIDIHTRLANGINHPDRDFHHVIANSMEKKIFS
jgi:acyl-CoA thioesterase-1